MISASVLCRSAGRVGLSGSSVVGLAARGRGVRGGAIDKISSGCIPGQAVTYRHFSSSSSTFSSALFPSSSSSTQTSTTPSSHILNRASTTGLRRSAQLHQQLRNISTQEKVTMVEGCKSCPLLFWFLSLLLLFGDGLWGFEEIHGGFA